MAPTRNSVVIYKGIPTGYPIPGETLVYDESQTIDLDNEPLNGGVLLKLLDISIDPYLRRRMQDPKIPDLFPGFEVGDPLANSGVAVVIRSESPDVMPGDHVLGLFPFQEYIVLPSTQGLRVLDNKEKLPWRTYLSGCGMPAQTADLAWKEYAHSIVKKGDVAFVTAASGAVGAIVVQLAKADGMKVIASAGSDEKVEYVKSLGADVVFNYKTTSTREVLEKEGPIHIYWDNVGGEALEAALDNCVQHARFISCGMISSYNTKEPYNVKNLQQILWREVTIHGFLVASLLPKWEEEFFRTFPARIASGKIKYKEFLVRGLENSAQALVDVLKGHNFGKCVVVVADE